jgi:hypothetical protein
MILIRLRAGKSLPPLYMSSAIDLPRRMSKMQVYFNGLLAAFGFLVAASALAIAQEPALLLHLID